MQNLDFDSHLARPEELQICPAIAWDPKSCVAKGGQQANRTSGEPVSRKSDNLTAVAPQVQIDIVPYCHAEDLRTQRYSRIF